MTLRLSLGHIDEYDNRVASFAHQLGLDGVQLAPFQLLASEGCAWTSHKPAEDAHSPLRAESREGMRAGKEGNGPH